MNAVHNTLSHCVKCLKCMKGCPIDAIHFVDNKAVIQEDKCIDCGRCMDICTHNGIFSLTSELSAMASYSYTCVLVPSAYYSQFSSIAEIQKSFGALKRLGFDEVIDLTPYGAGVMNATVDYLQGQENTTLISSHCPVITRLIHQKYPVLASAIVPIDYASEIAARKERQRIALEQSLASDAIGIFLLSECPGKISLAKYPLENKEYEVDHAISIATLAPALRKAMAELEKEEKYPQIDQCADKPSSVEGLNFAQSGLLYAVKDGIRRILKDYSVINVDGIEKAIDVLELAEFERLGKIRFITMSSCYNGCVGGNFLWTNPFMGRIQIEEFIQTATGEEKVFTLDEVYRQMHDKQGEDNRSMSEKIAWYMKIEGIYEKLPGIDCGACGFPSCRYMAEEIAKGHRHLSNCRIL